MNDAELQSKFKFLAGQFSAMGLVLAALMATHPDKRALRRALDEIVTDIQVFAVADQAMKQLPPESRKALEHYYHVLDRLIARDQKQAPE